jgi:hypothetical protein
MFKKGQEVIVEKLHQYEFPGSARVVRLIEKGENKGKWLCEIPSGLICVAEDRMTDATQYWREKNGSNPQIPTPPKKRTWG